MSSSGVNFPVDGKGQRSTTEINRGAFIAAVEKTDSTLAAEIKGVRNWRHGYSKHVTKQVECLNYHINAPNTIDFADLRRVVRTLETIKLSLVHATAAIEKQ